MKFKIKYLIIGFFVLGFSGVAIGILAYFIIGASLPKLISLDDYKPLVVSEVYSRDGQKVGEFFNEKRIVVPYEKIPTKLIHAFVAAEDSQFFEHGGINFVSILRAGIANLKAGRSAQGASTITQQVARSLMLSPEKTITRKVKEAILANRMEKNLKKEEILFLYLNQIYLGHGAYGVQAAAENYFRKSVEQLTLAECAILAGLPQAPSRYSPLKKSPGNKMPAKERQAYVIGRMKDDGYITKEEAVAALNEPVKVYYNEDYKDVAPFYTETVRQFLNSKLGADKVLNEGIRVYTSMDLKKQMTAQKAIEQDLRELDKRQGFRGALKKLETPEQIAEFLVQERDNLILEKAPYRIIPVDGIDPIPEPLNLNKVPNSPNIPPYAKAGQVVKGVVTKVDSKWGLVTVRFAEGQGLIDLDDMKWARKPDSKKYYKYEEIKDPAAALSQGDVIEVKILRDKFESDRINEKTDELKKKWREAQKTRKTKEPYKAPEDLPKFEEYAGLALEQSPIAQGALLSFDLDTSDVIAMVGGTDFKKSEYNRALQAARQTGSTFKSIVYASAIDKGFTAATSIVDSPIVYDTGEDTEGKQMEDLGDEDKIKKWKPGNFGNKFSGDILFRNAIIQSLNIPTIKITEKISREWVEKYARRLGIFSPLNPDLSMALGSSGTTVYEMTKAFSTFAKAGKRIRPILIRKVTDAAGKEVLATDISIDEKFQKELDQIEAQFNPEIAAKLGISPPPAKAKPVDPNVPAEKDPFKFDNPDQLISPQTAYLITTLLQGVINEGTGKAARALGRPVAGKTGTTNGYFDAWFMGYTPNIATGVWVGFDSEVTLGKLETGASAALPAWLDYMKEAVEDKPSSDFTVPSQIVFANIDAVTGKLASARSEKVVRAAFLEGTEPQAAGSNPTQPTGEQDEEEKSFFREDLSN